MTKENLKNYLSVDIEKIKPNDYNPKKDFKEDETNRRMFDKVKESLQSHKQIDPIIVRELKDGTFEIINGFHRYTAMKELGYKEIEIKNLGNITREDAIAKALSTEYPKIPLDEVEVGNLLKESLEKGYDLSNFPFSMEEIDARVEMLDFNWEDLGDNSVQETLAEEDQVQTEFMVTCPKCNHRFQNKNR